MRFDVPPARAFEVLSQPRSYAFWVTGVSEIEDHDLSWPAPGARLRHSEGVGPLRLRDTTRVLRSEPPLRLELESRARPLLVARVTLSLQPEDGGTRVRMDEVPTGGLLELPMRLPPFTQLTRVRNRESLRRLRRLAEAPR